MGCDALMKGTQVDGIYTADPKTDPDATRYDTITYQDVLAQDLKVMDQAAISLTRENGIPIVVFSLKDGIAGALTGQGRHTVVSG